MYAASKVALNALSEALQAEVEPSCVAVGCTVLGCRPTRKLREAQ
jgi:short-subunit dehydrogenase